MTQTIHVSIQGGPTFRARPGDVLLDAALRAGVEVPHDCRSGLCGTCRIQVLQGQVDGCEQGHDGVLACQARLMDDLSLAIEERPPTSVTRGVVTGLRRIAADVFDVAIRTDRPFEYWPGQYAQFEFAGFPARCFSPTLPISGPRPPGELRLHIQRAPGGRVSGSLGKAIRPGHRVRVAGPFGSAYLRQGRTERLVLVASGTGFAPVWSIAHAALCEMPDREMVVVTSAKSRDQFYMGPALLRLATFPRVAVYAGLREPAQGNGLFFTGSPLDVMPSLRPSDSVYACGAPALVNAIAERARAAGAQCHADAFTPPPRAPASLMGSAQATARRLVEGAMRASRLARPAW